MRSEGNQTPPTNYFKFGKAMLRFWGLWPDRRLSAVRNTLYKAYGVLMISCTLVPYVMCFIMDMMIQFRVGKWMDMLPRISVALAMVLGCLKLLVYVSHKDTIEKFMVAYEGDVFTYESTPYFRPNLIIAKCVFLYNIQVAVCFGLCLIMVMTDIEAYLKQTVPYLDNTTIPALPFVNWLPFDFTQSPGYELSFILTNFWFFVSADIIFVYDTICMGLMIHTAGQLKILRKALETLRLRILDKLEFEGEKPSAQTVDLHLKASFRKCAVHHQAIIRQKEDFQNIYSTMIFLQFFISCLMVCFTILIVTSDGSPTFSRITSLFILLCSMWELFVYCYFGNEIIFESNRLKDSIYKSEWTVMDKTVKSSMLIMMIRAQKPIVFTAGGFVPLSLETFIRVLKASYTYYAFLRTVAND